MSTSEIAIERMQKAQPSEPKTAQAQIQEIIQQNEAFEHEHNKPAFEKRGSGEFEITAKELKDNNYTPLRAFIAKQASLHEGDPQKYPNWNKYRGGACAAAFGAIEVDDSGVPTGKVTAPLPASDYGMSTVDGTGYAIRAGAEPTEQLPTKSDQQRHHVFGYAKGEDETEDPELERTDSLRKSASQSYANRAGHIEVDQSRAFNEKSPLAKSD